jgi:hypothetical protein
MEGCPDADVVFIYVADKLIDTKRIKTSMERLLTKITGITAKDTDITEKE